MASLRELIIKISANSTSFQSEIARASRMGADYHKTMEQGGKKSAAASRQAQQALQELNDEFASVKTVAAGVTGAIAGAFAVSSLIETADNWGQLSSRVKMATDSVEQYNFVQSRLMEISDRTYKPIEEQAELFIRSANAMNELGYSTELTLDFIDSISSALTINAASADKGSSAINALSKSMVLGKVSGGEWQTVMEVMPTVIGDVARHLGITETAVKKLASEGKLSMQTFSDALIGAKNRNAELADSMPNTVADAMTKLSNHWKKYLGDTNEANGATQVFVSGLNGVSDNLDALTVAGTALAGVGIARYLGNMARSTGTATASLIAAKKEQIGLAAAQERAARVATSAARVDVYRAQQALQSASSTQAVAIQQEKLTAAQTRYTVSQTRLQAAIASGSATEIARAKAALSRAQAAVVATKSADAQAVAERKLAAAQAGLVRTRTAQSAASSNLNNLTSISSRVAGSASALVGLLGGIPGLLMIGAGAWYTMYQSQERARQSAREYADQIGELSAKTATMTTPELSDTVEKTRTALAEQNRLVTEQVEKVRSLETSIAGYQQMLANPGPVIGGVMINHLTGLDTATQALSVTTQDLAVERVRLTEKQEKAREIEEALSQVSDKLTASIRARGAEENKAYQALIRMNGVQSEFNRILGSGNGLLAQRAMLVNVPMRLPQAEATDQQADALKRSRRELELSKLKGEEKERRRLSYSADDLGLTADPQHDTLRSEIINNGIDVWKKTEADKPQKKTGKTDAEKTEDIYSRLIKQQREQIALTGDSNELARVKYQISQEELSTLNHVQKTELLRNATVLDMLKTQEKFKSLQEELLTPEEALLQKTRERIKLLKEAAPASDTYREAMEKISKQSIQSAPEFAGVDASIGGPSGELIKIAEAQTELEKWHKTQLEMQKQLLDEKEINEQIHADRVAEINKTNAERLKGIQSGYTSASLSMFSELASQSAGLLQGIGQEGSAAYRMLFLASKAAAIAQAVINTELAATKAMAEGGLIFGMPAATIIRAAGYASVGLIAGQTLAGMAHDGIDRVPETGTWLLQKGEKVTTARTSAKLDSTLEAIQQQKQEERQSAISGFTYSPTIQVNGNPDDRTLLMIQEAVKRGAKEGYQLMVNSLARGQGDGHKALVAGYQTKRRTG